MCDEVVVVQQQAFFPSVELCLQEFDHYCVWLNNTIGPLSKRWIWGGSLCALLDKFTTLAGLLKATAVFQYDEDAAADHDDDDDDGGGDTDDDDDCDSEGLMPPSA